MKAMIFLTLAILSLTAQAQDKRIFEVSGRGNKVTDAHFGQLYVLTGKITKSVNYDSKAAFNLAVALQTTGIKLEFDPAADISVTECQGDGTYTIYTGIATDVEIIEGLQNQAAFVLGNFQCNQ